MNCFRDENTSVFHSQKKVHNMNRLTKYMALCNTVRATKKAIGAGPKASERLPRPTPATHTAHPQRVWQLLPARGTSTCPP